MRTTVTLEPDVARLLQDSAHRTRRSFKETLNEAVRAGLSAKQPPPGRESFVVEAFPLGLRAGMDPAGFNTLLDELESDEFLHKAGT